jgi:hypothetical protein
MEKEGSCALPRALSGSTWSVHRILSMCAGRGVSTPREGAMSVPSDAEDIPAIGVRAEDVEEDAGVDTEMDAAADVAPASATTTSSQTASTTPPRRACSTQERGRTAAGKAKAPVESVTVVSAPREISSPATSEESGPKAQPRTSKGRSAGGVQEPSVTDSSDVVPTLGEPSWSRGRHGPKPSQATTAVRATTDRIATDRIRVRFKLHFTSRIRDPTRHDRGKEAPRRGEAVRTRMRPHGVR